MKSVETQDAGIAWADYVRAERFLPWNASRLTFELDVEPSWIGESEQFWYRAEKRTGPEFIVVDPATGKAEPAFDHIRLAAALSLASGEPADGNNLPFSEIEFTESGSITFVVEKTKWTLARDTYELTSEDATPEPEPDVVRSPDGAWDAFTRDHNLWLRNVATGKEKQLTTEGAEKYEFGSSLTSPLASSGISDPDGPAVIWSPDSKRFLSCRIDARNALQLHLVQSVPKDGSIRPRLHSYAYPLPGDPNETTPQAELWTFDVNSGKGAKTTLDPISMLYYGSPLNPSMVWWTSDGQRLYVLTRDRGYLAYRLHEIDAVSGKTREVIVETATRGIEPFLIWAAVNVRIINDGKEILWYSQRDGWAHLYLYDGESGKLKTQLTSGSYNVSEVVRIDEASRALFFAAVGRETGGDPYYTKIYRVSLDGGEPQLLTPEEAEHGAIFSPSGRYFVNTYSRRDLPPVSVLRDEFGAEVTKIATADIEPLIATGWRFPERFTAKARDGITDVYGVIFRPTNFDANVDYPVIDNIYGGPQVNQAPTSFADSKRVGGATRAGRGRGFWHAQAIAELGFVVVMIDGLGMPARSRAYHDVTYRDLGDGGIEDHIVALRQLKDRYPYLDLDRVGIFGHSAGGYASAHAILTFPDFYKVCVSSAGNHDHRLDKASWVERYMGLPVEDHYRQQANQTLAANLKGKLLLIHGEMDENVHPASTLVAVDALIKENKDFDLLIIPNQPHSSDHNPYFVRRRWDYFVRHLRGEEPPVGYAIQGPQ